MANANPTITTFNAILKEWYPDDEVIKLGWGKNPLLAILEKKPAGGIQVKIALGVDDVAGSNTFSNAQANLTGGQWKSFAVTLYRDYVVTALDGLLLASGTGDKAAFQSILKSAMTSVLRAASANIEFMLWGTGTGKRGRIASGQSVSSAVLTVGSGEALRFQVDGKYVAASGDGTGGVKQTAGADNVFTCVAVDEVNDTVTMDVAPNSFGANTVSGSDYLFRQGDYNASAPGIPGWLPSAGPVSGTLFFGVERTSNPRKLAGLVFDGRQLTIRQALINCANQLDKFGGTPDIAFISYNNYNALIGELETKGVYNGSERKVGNIGFSSVKINGLAGPVDVLPGRYIDDTVGYMLQTNTWEILVAPEKAAKGPFPSPDNQLDGLPMLRQSSQDGVEMRLSSYFAPACRAPGLNAVIKFT